MVAPRLRPSAGPVRAGATGRRHRRAPDRSRLPDGGQRRRDRLLRCPQEPSLAADRPGCFPPRRGGARGRSQARARGRRRARNRPAVRGPEGGEPSAAPRRHGGGVRGPGGAEPGHRAERQSAGPRRRSDRGPAAGHIALRLLADGHPGATRVRGRPPHGGDRRGGDPRCPGRLRAQSRRGWRLC